LKNDPAQLAGKASKYKRDQALRGNPAWNRMYQVIEGFNTLAPHATVALFDSQSPCFTISADGKKPENSCLI
jgi:hypothetical protein